MAALIAKRIAVGAFLVLVVLTITFLAIRAVPGDPAMLLLGGETGTTSAAQLANEMALRLDHEEMAEMSCIAGVGAGVPSLLRTAHSGRPMIVLDGCALQCARLTLKNRGINPILPIDLSRHGVRKRLHERPTAEEKRRVWDSVVYPAAAELLLLHLGSQNPDR